MIEENSSLTSLNASNNITIGEGVTFVGSISASGKAFINGNVPKPAAAHLLPPHKYQGNF